MSDELEKKEPGLEERFAKIDAILDAMEDENVTLDRSFALYKEGLEQIKAAGQSLDTIEKAMLVLNQDGNWRNSDGDQTGNKTQGGRH